MNKYWVLLLIISALSAQAVEFTVNTTDDTVDANIADGLCLDSMGECSLRAAIMQSNILGSDEVIYLPRGGVFELTLNNDIDTQGDNDLDIFDSLTLSIVSPEIPIESLSEMPAIFAGSVVKDRVFEIHAGASVNFKGLFIAYGDAADSFSHSRLGGGIYISSQVEEFRISDSILSFNQAGYGAGIYSHAALTRIENTDISHNILTSPALPLFGIAGAGVFHAGAQLTMNKTAVHHNVIEALGFFASALQFEGENSEVSVLNSLVADNGIWPLGDSGNMNGITGDDVNLYINNSNITGNTWYGIRFESGNEHTLTIRNSVLSHNEFDNCDVLTGELNLGGGETNPAHIISSDDSCLLPELSNNIENAAANLSVLVGRFESLGLQFFSTQYPMKGSVLIDAGSPLDTHSDDVSACEITDIRGVIRPLNGGVSNVCDVGIFESGDLIFQDGFERILARIKDE